LRLDLKGSKDKYFLARIKNLKNNFLIFLFKTPHPNPLQHYKILEELVTTTGFSSPLGGQRIIGT
jgi:hypothetical protein